VEIRRPHGEGIFQKRRRRRAVVAVLADSEPK
jgi:hypothetical protein